MRISNFVLNFSVLSGFKLGVDFVIYIGGNVNALDRNGETLLHSAAARGNEKIVQALCEAGANKEAIDVFRDTPLHYAARCGNTKVVQVLCEAGANKEAVDNCGNAPLYIAARYGHTGVIRTLYEAGADINAAPNFGQPALHAAALYGKLEAIRALLAVGANINAVTDPRSRYTPLHSAALHHHIEAMKILISNDADRSALDTTNKTFLDLIDDDITREEIILFSKTLDKIRARQVFGLFINRHSSQHEEDNLVVPKIVAENIAGYLKNKDFKRISCTNREANVNTWSKTPAFKDIDLDKGKFNRFRLMDFLSAGYQITKDAGICCWNNKYFIIQLCLHTIVAVAEIQRKSSLTDIAQIHGTYLIMLNPHKFVEHLMAKPIIAAIEASRFS